MTYLEKLQNIYNKLQNLLILLKKIGVKKITSIPSQINKIIKGTNKIDIYLGDDIPYEINENDLKDITSIYDYQFYERNNLIGITIPNNITSINRYAFCDCNSITDIIIPNSVTALREGAFYKCSNLENIIIHDNITILERDVFSHTKYYNDKNNWDDDCLYINNYFLEGNLNLTYYEFKPGTKIIGGGAFFSAISSKLKKVVMPNSVTDICESAFYNCTFLSSVILSENLINIGDYAFSSCNFSLITLPGTVENIERNAFYKCSNLRNIYIKSINPPKLASITTIPTTATIHVPIGSGNKYKSATSWSYHASRIIEDIEI